VHAVDVMERLPMTTTPSNPLSCWFAISLILGGCGNSNEEPARVPDAPVLETHVVPIFEKSCGGANAGCHRREAFNALENTDCRGWLSLENAPLGSVFYAGAAAGMPTGCPDLELYDRLLMPAWMCGAPVDADEPHVANVVPCEPEASLLYRVLGEGPLCSRMRNFMPPGERADPGEVETIRRWIANGAPALDRPAVACNGRGGGQ
jgi:hypothetical protein